VTATTRDGPRVFDGHTDVLLDLHLPERGHGRSFFERSAHGHLDLPRARDGGYAGGLFAIFVPNDGPVGHLDRTAGGYKVPLAPAVPPARAKRFTAEVLERLNRLEAAADGELVVVRDVDGLRAGLAAGAVVAVVHLEGAAAVDPDLGNLDRLYAAGVRSIGLTWSRPNAFGHGVPFAYPRSPDTGPGLTEAGRTLVRACDERGILLDLAHLNERGFWDVAALTERPLVVSHAGVHAICPSTRNLTDEQLDAVGDSGGVVGVTLDVPNLRPDGGNDPATPLGTFVDHVMHVANRLGVEHVALGSDFDGCRIPDAVGDVTGVPRLLDALRDRGFGPADLERFARGNWLRVLGEAWA